MFRTRQVFKYQASVYFTVKHDSWKRFTTVSFKMWHFDTFGTVNFNENNSSLKFNICTPFSTSYTLNKKKKERKKFTFHANAKCVQFSSVQFYYIHYAIMTFGQWGRISIRNRLGVICIYMTCTFAGWLQAVWFPWHRIAWREDSC